MREESRVQKLQRFHDGVFRTLDKYINYLAKTPAEKQILIDVKQELYDPEIAHENAQRKTRRAY